MMIWIEYLFRLQLILYGNTSLHIITFFAVQDFHILQTQIVVGTRQPDMSIYLYVAVRLFVAVIYSKQH